MLTPLLDLKDKILMCDNRSRPQSRLTYDGLRIMYALRWGQGGVHMEMLWDPFVIPHKAPVWDTSW